MRPRHITSVDVLANRSPGGIRARQPRCSRSAPVLGLVVLLINGCGDGQLAGGTRDAARESGSAQGLDSGLLSDAAVVDRATAADAVAGGTDAVTPAPVDGTTAADAVTPAPADAGPAPGDAGPAPADAVATPDAAPLDVSLPPDGPVDPFAGEPDVALRFASGSRLLARKRVSSGNTPLFDGWYDSQLQVECAFRGAADGMYRCLPARPRGETGWGAAYADATCSKSALLLRYYGGAGTACATVVPSYWTITTSGCNAEVYPVSGSLAPRTYYFLGADGTCKSAGSTPAVDLGAPLPLTSFTPATFVDSPAQAGVVPRYLVAADGARGFAGWHDPARAEACRMRRAADGVFRCLSTHEGDTMHFADDACTKIAFHTLSCEPAPSSVAVSGTACPITYEARAVGPASPTPMLHHGPTCGGGTSSSAWTVYEIGPAIPLGGFAAAVEAPPTGKRLEQTVLLVGSLLQSIGDLHDSLRNEHCKPAIAGDGKLRCLPWPTRGGVWTNAFSDSACTSPLLAYDVSPPACNATASLVAISDRSTCPTRRRIFAVGPKHLGAVYRIDASGACAQVASWTSPGYVMGAEVPASSFEQFL